MYDRGASRSTAAPGRAATSLAAWPVTAVTRDDLPVSSTCRRPGAPAPPRGPPVPRPAAPRGRPGPAGPEDRPAGLEHLQRLGAALAVAAAPPDLEQHGLELGVRVAARDLPLAVARVGDVHTAPVGDG